MTRDRDEDRRQLVHLAMTAFAVALRWLTPTQAAACAGAACVLNWIVLPLVHRDMRRPDAPFLDGVRTYPVAVLGLVLALPLPQAAAAWGVLGVGDATSNLIGRRFGRPPLLGRADRSLVGTLAFVAAATPVALLLWSFTARTPPDAGMAAAALAAAAAGAAGELLPLPRRMDDNLPIAAAAALTLALLA